MKAARYLGVAPWDLVSRPDGVWWVSAALSYEEAEAQGRSDYERLHARS